MLNGEFGDNRYNGIIEINDPNGKLRVNGLSVLKDKDSEFDLVLQARPQCIGFKTNAQV